MSDHPMLLPEGLSLDERRRRQRAWNGYMRECEDDGYEVSSADHLVLAPILPSNADYETRLEDVRARLERFGEIRRGVITAADKRAEDLSWRAQERALLEEWRAPSPNRIASVLEPACPLCGEAACDWGCEGGVAGW